MKKQLLLYLALFVFALNINAQNFLDVYRNDKVVGSVKASDVDSMVVNEENNSLDFYKEGMAFFHTKTTLVDSLKVLKTEDEPLVYLGILGFNQELYEQPFGFLEKKTASNFKNFVNNLPRKDGTLLYYGVDQALDMLENTSFPTQVGSVNLITFTDGLDQGSLMMNSNYATDEQYLEAIGQRIGNTKVKGLPITAYSIGLRGNDVTNYNLFTENLNKLASSADKAIEVTNMSSVNARLQEISDQIISISNKQTISMTIPGQSDGTIIRFTFDYKSVSSSDMYIEGTFQLSDRSLHNVTYHGIKAESGNVVSGKQEGIFVTYTFNGLQREDGYGLIPTDNIRQYYKSSFSTAWQENSEFSPSNNTQTTINHSGAVIMLVLDCSSSLGSQFVDMKSYAKEFIDSVANNAAEHKERPFGGTYYVNGVQFNMVYVTGGTFKMGSEESAIEEPIHDVTLSDYYIGETEVTQELWCAVMGNNPSYHLDSEHLPVEKVSWDDCQEFIRKLNELTGKKFRLPTEAEWEYAARGGQYSKNYKYAGSNNIDEVAWYYCEETHEVGMKTPNELGLFDMSGNVCEWCQDYIAGYDYDAQTNPKGPTSGEYRVYRGGGYIWAESACRVSYRDWDLPNYRFSGVGFRLAQ